MTNSALLPFWRNPMPSRISSRDPLKSWFAALCAASLGSIAPAVFAQATAATAPAWSSAASTVELPPFEVRTDKDTGYSAQNTTSGTRLNAKLADTPAAISVFTKEFIEDIGATSIEDLTLY